MTGIKRGRLDEKERRHGGIPEGKRLRRKKLDSRKPNKKLCKENKRMSVPGSLACLRLILQSLCDFFPPSGTLLDLSDWGFFVCW
jgi:hypothetical protein